MRTIFILFTAFTIQLLVHGSAFVAFGQAPRRGIQAPKVKFMSEESLARLINTNMSKQQVIGRFGEPDLTPMPPQSGILRWDFTFAPDESRGPKRFIASGLTVLWKGDKMVRWAPAYGTTGGKNSGEFMKRIEPRSIGADSAKTNHGLSFWAVSSDKIEGGRYIDTPELKKLGWIAKEPALIVGRLKSASAGHEPVNYDDKTPREEYRFDFTLLPDDAEAFQKLTEKNIGKQLLLMFGQEPIMAPRVHGPIQLGRFSITISDEKRFQALRESFALILQE